MYDERARIAVRQTSPSRISCPTRPLHRLPKKPTRNERKQTVYTHPRLRNHCGREGL
jgi:hypothetical protein